MTIRTFLELAPNYLLKQEVANNLDEQSLVTLTQLNKRANTLFKSSLAYKYFKNFVERSAKKQISVMLAQSLNFNITVSQLRNVVYSAVKLGDTDLIKMILKGRESEFKQSEFPKKWVDKTNTYDFSAIVEALESGKDVENVLAQFRIKLDAIVKEKGFPFQALLDCLQIYGNKYDTWNHEQRLIFSKKVIGFFQRLSPVWLKLVYVNCWSDGGNTLNTLTPHLIKFIDPAYEVPNIGLGFDFCVNLFGSISAYNNFPVFLKNGFMTLKTYLENKQKDWDEYVKTLPCEKSSSCKRKTPG